jgi:hypothetical protein
MQTTPEIPFACDLSRLDTEARQREQTLLAWFRESYGNAVWTGSEYRLDINADRSSLAQLGELLALERLCCPFLTFRIEVDRGDIATLAISGREGVKGFIEAEFMRES